MSIFDRLDVLTSRVADRANAIPFTLTPMAATPNGRPAPDAGRDVVSARGILDTTPGLAPVEFGARSTSGGANALRALADGEAIVLSVDRAYLPELPHQGDQVEFPGRADLLTHTITRVDPDGLARVELRLARR